MPRRIFFFKKILEGQVTKDLLQENSLNQFLESKRKLSDQCYHSFLLQKFVLLKRISHQLNVGRPSQVILKGRAQHLLLKIKSKKGWIEILPVN